MTPPNRIVVPCLLAYLWIFVLRAEFAADSAAVDHPTARHVMLDNSRDAKRTREQMAESVARLMAMDEASVVAMVSRDNGFAAVRCPGCKSVVSEFGLGAPDHVLCGHCGQKYPHPDYPETHVHQGVNVSGEPVEWKYYMEGGRGYPYFFSAVLRNARHHHLAAKTQDLGRLYHQTREKRYARRAAAIIVALAEASPHWCARHDHTWYGREIVDGRPRKGGVWGRGHWCEMPLPCVFAYDLTYDSPAWDELARERAGDVRRAVEEWFRASHRMILELHEDAGGRFGNLHPYTIRHVIAAGLTLGDPDIIHSVVPWFEGVTRNNFHFDGMWREGTPDYHGQTTWNLDRAIRAIKGYSDPAGYVDRTCGLTLRDADLKQRFPILATADRALASMQYPDGRRVTVHDTHWGRPSKEPGERANTELNAYGHFALTRGTGVDAVQVHLHFCPLTAHGHYHGDRLSMALYAAGTEILPDIGYATDRRCHRYFATGSLSHNMSYAGWDQPRKAPETTFAPGELNTSLWARSSLLAYDPGEHCERQVQLVEAESPGPAWQEVEEARRLIMLVAVDDQRSYVLDLFRLRGGEWHESILRPSADEDCEETCTLEATPRPGTLAGPDVEYGQFTRGVGYRYLVHHMRTADASNPWSVTWEGKDSGAAVRCFLNGQTEAEAILARAPTIRPSRNVPADRDKYQGPYLMRRREGEAGLVSAFAAVYEAWAKGGTPRIDGVDWLTPEPSDPFAVAVRVRVGAREDLLYCATDRVPRRVGGVTVRGPVAALSRAGGTPTWGYVYGHATIERPDGAVEGRASIRSRLVGVHRQETEGTNAFDLEGRLADGDDLAGVWLRVVHADGSANGYRIVSASPHDDGTRILVQGDPGFERTADGMRMLFFPNYTIPGKQFVEIARPRLQRW